MSDGERVAAALRKARAREGWTLTEAACRLGWTGERLRWLEQGIGELDEGEDRAVIILYGFAPDIARAVERLVRVTVPKWRTWGPIATEAVVIRPSVPAGGGRSRASGVDGRE